MTAIKLTAYHTQEASLTVPRTFPKLAEGYEEWLGDGYYFWQDEYFAKWWGYEKKCAAWNLSRMYTIYQANMEFEEDEFVDTVFNEEDYYQFVKQIEKFAQKHKKQLGRKPNLKEFNEFIADFDVWEDIKVIRFQDIPENNEHIEVTEFYYKKRIQIRVNDPKVIKKFTPYKTLGCI